MVPIVILLISICILIWAAFKKILNIYSSIALICILIAFTIMTLTASTDLSHAGYNATVSLFGISDIPLSWVGGSVTFSAIAAIIFSFIGVSKANDSQKGIARLIVVAAFVILGASWLWGIGEYFQQGIGPG
jgi:hypothetical protein